jgi:hypothetical protein
MGFERQISGKNSERGAPTRDRIYEFALGRNLVGYLDLSWRPLRDLFCLSNEDTRRHLTRASIVV